jgi:hypothetical protein
VIDYPISLSSVMASYSFLSIPPEKIYAFTIFLLISLWPSQNIAFINSSLGTLLASDAAEPVQATTLSSCTPSIQQLQTKAEIIAYTERQQR